MNKKLLSHISGDIVLLGIELSMTAYAGLHALGRYGKIRGFVRGYTTRINEVKGEL